MGQEIGLARQGHWVQMISCQTDEPDLISDLGSQISNLGSLVIRPSQIWFRPKHSAAVLICLGLGVELVSDVDQISPKVDDQSWEFLLWCNNNSPNIVFPFLLSPPEQSTCQVFSTSLFPNISPFLTARLLKVTEHILCISLTPNLMLQSQIFYLFLLLTY